MHGKLLMKVEESCISSKITFSFNIFLHYHKSINFDLIYSSGEFNIYRADTFWLVVFGSLVGWGGTYCVKQTQVQRYCCMESKSKARQ